MLNYAPVLTGRQFLIFSFCLTAKEKLFRIGTVRIIHGWHCLSNKFIRAGDENKAFCGDIVYSFDLLNGSAFFRCNDFLVTECRWSMLCSD